MAEDEKIVVHINPDLEDLIPEYQENRHRDIQSISEALQKGDYETIRILGHNMKGSGEGYGFEAITAIGRSIEQAAKDRNPQEINRQIQELSSYLEKVEVVHD